MGLRCSVSGLTLVLLTAVTSSAANSPIGIDSAVPAKPACVKNAPFSADVITQYDRTLDNGGHIHRETRGKIFRDNLGRIRTENQPPAVQPGSEKYDHITINDPVQQVIVYLNPKNKTATIVHFGEVGPAAPGISAKQSAPKDKSKVRLGGQPGTGSLPTDTLGIPNVPSGQANVPSAHQVQTSDPSTSKMDSTIFTNTAGATIVPLGTKVIEGVSATGTRTTRTINAGTIGNDTPIVCISDSWVSSDLKVTVLTETDDGQAGRSTMKLVNIVRSEPNVALFQIPADYTVKDNALAASSKH
jgi:hypothetical protein